MLYPIRKPSRGGEPKSLQKEFSSIPLALSSWVIHIGKVSGLIVPVMCAMYVLASLYSLCMPQIYRCRLTMLSHAFGAEAAYGGLPVP